MSHYTDEHGAPCDYNPRLRGGPGSTGEALYRTCLLEIGLVIENHLRRIAAALDIPPEELDEIERKAEEKNHDRRTA